MDEEAAGGARPGPGSAAVAPPVRRLAPSLILLLALVPALGSACRGQAPSPATSTPVPIPVIAPPPAPPPPPPAPPVAWRPSDLPKIDVHVHLSPGGAPRALALLGGQGIKHLVNLSGGSPGRGLEEQMAEARRFPGRISVFCNADFREARTPGYGKRMAKTLEQSKAMGAIGLKIPKGLGLGYEGPDGKLLPVDDPGLDPLWKRAGELHMPVAIHTGDPKAFWLPANMLNERWDELQVHQGWSFYGAPVSWQQLFDAFERLVARHPKTIFIGVHFGNDPEDPERVGQLLAKYPNLYIDTAARVPEIGRQDAAHAQAKVRALFERFQDRILFGTDAGIGAEAEDLMLGSSGADPPTPAEVTRFFDATWRYFETDQRGFEHPTPIQGRWKIDGIGLPPAVLAKVYAGNAVRLLGIPIAP
ncbi:MAG: hypothetical protein EXR72_26485 [Myxococcales bacterium]|nr:hypothetical protein [Myxococcales bacterium]